MNSVSNYAPSIQPIASQCLQAPIKLARYFLMHPVQLLLIQSPICSLAANAAEPHNAAVVGLIDYPLPQFYPKKHLYRNVKEIADNRDNDNNGCIDDIYGCYFDQQEAGKFSGYTETNFPSRLPSDHSSNMANILNANPSLSIKILPLSSYLKAMPIEPMLEYAKKMGCLTILHPNTRYMHVNLKDPSYSPGMKEYIAERLAEGQSPFELSYESAQAVESTRIQAIENYPGLFIGSAGNSGVDTDKEYIFPVSHRFKNKNILFVGQVNEEGRFTNVSSYGSHVRIAVRSYREQPPITGPCPHAPERPCQITSPEGFATSGAAATVARVAAGIKHINPILSPAQIKDILLTSGEAPPEGAKGYVILNEERALEKAKKTLNEQEL